MKSVRKRENYLRTLCQWHVGTFLLLLQLLLALPTLVVGREQGIDGHGGRKYRSLCFAPSNSFCFALLRSRCLEQCW